MTPSARISAAIGILDQILDGTPAEQALLRWSRGSRFAGSGDRAAVRDLVFDALRQRNTLSALGGGLSGRGLMIGLCRQLGQDTDAVFTGQGYAPAPLAEGEGISLPPPPDDLPDWLRSRWQASLGADAEAVARAMTRRAPVWLRHNPQKGSLSQAIDMLQDDSIEVEADRRLPGALRVTLGERRVGASRAYRDGLVELQDLSAQLACAMLPLRPGMRVLDYCAGGGGKALAMAARQPGLNITAHDIDARRMSDLPVRAERAGASIMRGQPSGRYDLVVADVPCSGSGTWRRNPDAKWRLLPEGLAQLQKAQADILDRVAALTASDGTLAYMTCSVLAEENDMQVQAFLARHPGFRLIARQLWTPLTASDGFFLALFGRSDHQA